MSTFSNPFDPNAQLTQKCNCGQHASQAEHVQDMNARAMEDRVVEGTVMRAIFPNDSMHRNFLRAVGSSTALAAIASVFPRVQIRSATL